MRPERALLSAPVVSVVVPCHNLGRYLDEAVASVLGQTEDDVDIVVVDDGSTDPQTRELLDGYERPRTAVLRQVNRGVAAARNHGIRESRAPYVACLDADDRIAPDYLRRAVELLEASPEVGFVASHVRMFGAERDVWNCGPCRFPEMLLTNRCHTAAVFRRSAWERAGGYCEILSRDNPFEDWDFWLTLLELGYRGEVIPDYLFEYRVRKSSRLHGPAQEPEAQGRFYREVWERHQHAYASAVGDLAELVGAELAQERSIWFQLLEARAGGVFRRSKARTAGWLGGIRRSS